VPPIATANPYLADIEKQYEAVRQSVAGIQQRAKDAGRGLVDDEKLSLQQQDKKLGKLAEEIEMIRGIETRNANIDAMNRQVAAAIGPQQEPTAYSSANPGAPEVRTVPVGAITELIRGDVFYWGQLMAAALLGSIPVALIYSFFVEYYVAGLTAGSVKA